MRHDWIDFIKLLLRSTGHVSLKSLNLLNVSLCVVNFAIFRHAVRDELGELKCQEGSSVRLPLPQPSRSQLVETQLAQLQAKNKALEEESLGFWKFIIIVNFVNGF